MNDTSSNRSARLPAGGRIDRGHPLRFAFDGREYHGCAGDTLASALLANGVHQVGTSIKYGRPRGIFAAGAEEPTALVQIERPFPEPMLTATTVELRDGLEASGLPGQGRVAAEADPARYDSTHAHCDVLVVGAGPTGLAAARTAAGSGARVVLADADTEFGGALLGATEELNGAPAMSWVERITAELAAHDEVRLLPRTTVLGYYDDNYLIAVEKRGEEAEATSRQRVWRIRAREVVLATGAHERPLVFAGNDRPGTMLAGAARTYLNRYGVRPGHRVVVFTTNDSAYAAACELADAGVEITALVEARPTAPVHWATECARRGIEPLAGHAVVGTSGKSRIIGVRVAGTAPDGAPIGPQREIDCDLLLVSGGWNPAVHLHSQARGALRYDEGIGAFVPAGTRAAARSAGAARGRFGTGECLSDGVEAGADACRSLGFSVPRVEVPIAAPVPVEPPLCLWSVADPGDAEPWTTHFVDLARDATLADVRRATGAGLRSVEHVKRYTTIGTAHDQGKTSGTLATGVIAEALGDDITALGTTTFRAPYTPIAFGALAGRDRGPLYDPIRVTAMHDWHVDQGAPFENVGQWRRPWYFPRSGEDMTTAVLRECRAARESVAIQDVSTLGKIDVQGPDAAEFLDLVYTNMMSTLKVGRIRYGLMCKADGMVFDDGTAIRLGDEHYLITTTSGNAAAVLEWLEEWLQTEWPHLRVHLTSVTEQWATVALVGPRSREVLARVAPGLDVSNDAFPFMSWQDGLVAGHRARVCRISFSGELAYEVNVSWWHGREVWEALIDAGKPFGITPYGTEAMHVLRAEKGFPIIGQDTDGTVAPQDLGMDWAVSKKKADFIGKRSFSRPDNLRQDRKQMVGLLPADLELVLPEGSQLVETPEPGPPPVPMLGHVTSSYRSAALGRGFALAMVKSGRARIGETVYSPVGDRLVPVTITDTVFYDKEGARRDG
ncbi:sarcosine oxidase subunit alpha [Spinactinospora alkalitolerans]|uniref:Sarcosine oxidase subunit alpha n=1 Tax=Spinactinospora alkalitolerans TaxID=687207 RepID=A0A852TVH8_9ACTN|nr:sarcosine oxidase subunit alpha family protein [Spinactinospora alkalitolerans]NYE48029.1 sarcosine oxidase subunit alpha [Spinactinospora alkalitolerans]